MRATAGIPYNAEMDVACWRKKKESTVLDARYIPRVISSGSDALWWRKQQPSVPELQSADESTCSSSDSSCQSIGDVMQDKVASDCELAQCSRRSKFDNYVYLSENYCMPYLKGECNRPASECNRVHPLPEEMELIIKMVGYIKCIYDNCPWANCLCYHTPLGPAMESKHVPKMVFFPCMTMPRDRVYSEYYSIHDPVLKLQRVNARRHEVNAMFVIDLHHQKALHVYYLLDKIFADNTYPIPWECQDNTSYVWISTGLGSVKKAKSVEYTDLWLVVRDYLKRAGLAYDLSHVGQLIGGFRVRLPRKYKLSKV